MQARSVSLGQAEVQAAFQWCFLAASSGIFEDHLYISILFSFSTGNKKKPKKKPGPLFLAKNGMNFGSTSSDLMGTYSSRTWFFMSPRSWSSAATASSGNDSMGGWVTDPPSTC